MRDTLIVVPCYNEAARLDPEAFERCASQDSRVRFLFVDDGSTDDTRAVLERLVERSPDAFALLPLPHNRGKAEAVRRGFLRGFETEPAYVGFWDADLATPLDDIATFREILEQKPELLTVFGSRVNLLGRSVRRGLLRHYVGRVFATAVAVVLRLPIYDTQCGAKLFRATPEVRQLFADEFVSGWVFDVEIIARLIRTRRRSGGRPARRLIYEEPIKVWRDIPGSKIRPRDFPQAALSLLRIHLLYMRSVDSKDRPAG